eukprot:TRINITY_DN11935_c0_g1_i1.p1 TRINITY_DN11935_c0_g1~~TRINITY_DN11935_c0_g1_i1.p1  ORF type:complete len:165 (+),score=15.34 TRINITY_DN11935_c0_g1_i1:16-510(+)
MELVWDPDEERFDLSKEFKTYVKDLFLLCDRDGHGALHYHSFKLLLRGLGYAPSEDQIKQLRTQHFRSDDKITVQGVVEAIRSYIESRPSAGYENGVKEAFQVYDYNGDGKIASKELFHIITRIGGPTKFTREEGGQMLNEFVADEKGRINKSDICNAIVSTLN